MGDQNYTFDQLLPYFKRTYGFTPPNNADRPENSSAEVTTDDWDANGGPIQVSYASWVNSISSWLRLSFESMGIKSIPSFYGGSLLGWSWLAITLDPKTQTRSSSAEFLREAIMESSNLVIYKSTLAKRVLFDNGSASGVLVNSGGIEYQITSNHEIIISAGVVSNMSRGRSQCPRQLMLSDTISAAIDGFWNWPKGPY